MPLHVTGLLAGLVVASLSTAVESQQLAPELTGFMLTLQRTIDGVAVACEAGCGWQSAIPTTVRCTTRKPCLTVTDTRVGVKVSANHAAFAITVDVSSTGMTLTCQRGCAWKTLTHDCQSATPCSVRVSEYGVNRAKPAKTP